MVKPLELETTLESLESRVAHNSRCDLPYVNASTKHGPELCLGSGSGLRLGCLAVYRYGRILLAADHRILKYPIMSSR